ncbi:gas vesicle protein [Flexivirga endophytica]|uniref:Gas vesicle protein n=1 Tax=Flexivirga endophytica TaxID=1849103 RepID=A0A916WWF9_9MICO|nr:GvpL/GvpF family gas vesicle protein [Flexivirga endophytica]GGB35349.1 gas vesicle protein [Flexivirga endophytica]GHB43141.1 gas vesicle protein [Flexivirga endophytica]
MTARTFKSEESVAEDVTETGCNVYGIVPAGPGRVPEDLNGIDDMPVRVVPHDEIAAVITDIRLDRPPGRRAELVAYSRVLDTLASSGAVVPVRFGSVVRDEEAVVTDLLLPQQAWFSRLLAELDGRAQFNLSVRYVQEAALTEVVDADPTIARLRERTRGTPSNAALADRVRLGELVSQAMQDKRTADADVLAEAVLPYAAAHRIRLGSDVDQLADFILLIDNDRRDDFEQRLESLAESMHGRMRLSLVGPLAPYEFVGGD